MTRKVVDVLGVDVIEGLDDGCGREGELLVLSTGEIACEQVVSAQHGVHLLSVELVADGRREGEGDQ